MRGRVVVGASLTRNGLCNASGLNFCLYSTNLL